MKRNHLVLVALAALLLVAAIFKFVGGKKGDHHHGKNEQAQEEVFTDRVVAKYNGVEIKKSTLNDELKKLFGGKLPGDKKDFDQFDHNFKEGYLKGYIISKILLNEALKSKVEETEEFKKNMAEIKTQLMQKLILDTKVKEAISEEKLQEKYNKFSEENKDREEIKASHILVASEDQAKQIAQELKSGAIFEDLAKKYSNDNTKDRGGDLGYFSKGQMVKPFEEAAFALKIGEITHPVKTDFGWHVIKLQDRRKVQVPNFEALKTQLEQELRAEFIDSYTKKLLDESKAEFFVNQQ